MKKTLWFEGAGCVPRGDLSNCRIRTAFRNDEGKTFYLEVYGFESNKYNRDLGFENIGSVDCCYELLKDGSEFRVGDVERKRFEYSHRELLKLVNENLGCSFEAIRIADIFYNYRVHAGGGKVNLMDDHKFDDEHAANARAAFERTDRAIMDKLNTKYSKIGLVSVHEDHILVRCFASKTERWNAGQIEREFEVAF